MKQYLDITQAYGISLYIFGVLSLFISTQTENPIIIFLFIGGGGLSLILGTIFTFTMDETPEVETK